MVIQEQFLGDSSSNSVAEECFFNIDAHNSTFQGQGVGIVTKDCIVDGKINCSWKYSAGVLVHGADKLERTLRIAEDVGKYSQRNLCFWKWSK